MHSCAPSAKAASVWLPEDPRPSRPTRRPGASDWAVHAGTCMLHHDVCAHLKRRPVISLSTPYRVLHHVVYTVWCAEATAGGCFRFDEQALGLASPPLVTCTCVSRLVVPSRRVQVALQEAWQACQCLGNCNCPLASGACRALSLPMDEDGGTFVHHSNFVYR